MRYLHFLLSISVLNVSAISAEPIRQHPDNGHYLLYKDKPVVLITSAEHYGAVVNLDFDYNKYLDTLHEAGLNYTRIFSGSYVENVQSFGIQQNTLAPLENRLIVPWDRSNTPGYVNGGNKFDLDKWNDRYFSRLKDFISEAAKRDIIVEITLFSSIYSDNNWSYSPLHPSNNINGTKLADRNNAHTLDNGNLLPYQEKLVRKVVQELNGFDNVFYEIQNEPWSDQTIPALYLNPYDSDSSNTWYKRSDLASPASIAWQQTISRYIKSEENHLPNRHMIAQNFCNFKYPIENVSPDIAIMNFHYAWPEAALWNYGWNRVISFDESGFSEKTDTVYRKQAWNFMLSGGGIYNNLDYSFAAGDENGTLVSSSPGHGGASYRAQLGILKNFIESFDFIRMKPAPMVVVKSPGVVTKALVEPERQFAIYCDGSNNEGRCVLALDIPPGIYHAEWINTRTGGHSGIRDFTHTGGIFIITSPEYQDDIALYLRRK